MSAVGTVRVRRIGLIVALLVSVVAPWSAAQETGEATRTAEPESAEPAPSPAQAALDAIHRDLVGLRFEKALSGIQTLLGQSGLGEDDRAEALVLRGQAHVAFGDLAAAEEDYRQILRLRPGYVPDPSLTPRKARERFEKVQAELIGRLQIRIRPADAQIRIDGRPVPTDGTELRPLLAGEHRVHAEREGFDAAERLVLVEASKDQLFELELVPNARSVVLYTEPDGVAVSLDGVPVGTTERVDGVGRPARLGLAHLPLGEHVFEFTKPCHRAQRRADTLTIDLLDVGPKHYGVIAMVRSRATLQLSGPAGAEVRVDGSRAGELPLSASELCPGTHEIDVRLGGRTIWADTVSLEEGRVREIAIGPRPNVLVLGSERRPESLNAAVGCCSVTVRRSLPRGDPGVVETWVGAGLPRDTDLVLAHEASRDRWLLYSPILESVVPLETDGPSFSAPRWVAPRWGLFAADSDAGGPARAVVVTVGGPADRAGLREGDAIQTLGGRRIAGAGELHAALAAATPEGVQIGWTSREGAARTATIRPDVSPTLDPAVRGSVEALWQAAWATAETAGRSATRPAAQANLALLLSRHGLRDAAVRAWRAVRWGAGSGVGAGTVAYLLGADLEALGRDAEAIDAYRTAAASDSTMFHHDGPPVAGAARDRLADLGQGLSAR